MADSFVSIATSLDRSTLDRLEKFLSRQGLTCQVGPVSGASARFALTVANEDAEKARRKLEEISLHGGDLAPADEVVEIRCDDTERTEIATWLQLLLDEKDEEGSSIFFYLDEYEFLLDQILTEGVAEAPVFLLRGLASFLPEGNKRVLMSRALQEFFHLIDAVSADEEN